MLEVYVGAEQVVGAGHPTATRRTARALAAALRSVVHLVDPQAIILGGTLAADPEVATMLHALLNAVTLAGGREPVEVRRSELGPDAALVGAATRVLDRVVADPTLVPEVVPETAATRSA
ncbi:MAG: ROK family protein [Acidimicrobiia bacterium]